MSKIYKYKGEQFTVSEPKDCRITVTGKSLTGIITIFEKTREYREEVNGWGTNTNSLDGALRSCCQRILDVAARKSKDDLCKGMDDFYEKLT